MLRVAGTDPGTSSLDVLILEDGAVADQTRFSPKQLHANADAPTQWLIDRGPYDLIAGPSGYGLPLKRAAACTAADLDLMALVRPDERGQGQGVFLPGVIHLATVPAHRKLNRIDMGTADKLCVTALAIAQHPVRTFCLVELGSAFTACIVVSDGKIVDGLGGTSGPLGWRSGGAWDGEVAYLLSPLSKHDLFTGGIASAHDRPAALVHFCESLLRAVAGLRAVTPFMDVILAGRLLEDEPVLTDIIAGELSSLAAVHRLPSLPNAWVKHAAQGSALLADALLGGRFAPLAERMELCGASGTVLDWLCHPRAAACRSLLL
jgi:predicted butyrate kinase (DUF1464 family)